MDIYGFEQKLDIALHILITGMRGTGRTSRLIETYKEGDIVVFAKHAAARSFEREREVKRLRGPTYRVTWIIVDPNVFIYDGLTPHMDGRRGKVLFDHCWIEDYYLGVIREAGKTLKRVKDEARA